MKVHVHTTLAKSFVKEEKKENSDPIHYTQTVQAYKHKMTKTPGFPAFRTGMVGCRHVVHVRVLCKVTARVCVLPQTAPQDIHVWIQFLQLLKRHVHMCTVHCIHVRIHVHVCVLYNASMYMHAHVKFVSIAPVMHHFLIKLSMLTHTL